MERGGAWDDQCTLLMPVACLPDAFRFAVTAAREISVEVTAPPATAHCSNHEGPPVHAGGLALSNPHFSNVLQQLFFSRRVFRESVTWRQVL
jgi:hypothetical protein